MICQQIFYEGRVQGVGFRVTCQQIARGFEVTGWVRNLPDGRVQLQCCGEGNEVDRFLEAIAESEMKSNIESATAIPIHQPASQRGFEILS